MSEEPILPFAKPVISDEAIQEVVETLKSGWITTGPRVQKFEAMLKDYFEAGHAFACSSATAGLHMALLALDLQPGDEVITSAFTFAASANTIVQAGGVPRFVDIDETYNMDMTELAAAITDKTRVIMPVHFAGLPVDLGPVYELAKQHNLIVIEDAAQSIGAEYQGKKLGSFGDVQVFSFHPNKNMTTGEGGCITVQNERYVEVITQLRFHGIDRSDAWNRFSKSGSQHYAVVRPGFKYNMMDIQAALGIHQLPALDSFNAARADLAKRYFELLQDCPGIKLPVIPGYDHKHAWHLFAVRVMPESGMSRDEFVAAMKDENICLGIHYHCPAHLYVYMQQFGYQSGDFPVAEQVADSVVSLPLFPILTEQEQDRVVDTMKKLLMKDGK